MSIFFAILTVVFLGLYIAAFFKSRRLEKLLLDRENTISTMKQESEHLRQQFESETIRIQNATQTSIIEAQKLLDQQFEDLKQETERIRHHYQTEAQRVQVEADSALSKAQMELESLRKFESLRNAEEETQKTLDDAVSAAMALKREAETLLEEARTAGNAERSLSMQKAREIRNQAEAMLNQATCEAGRIVEEANKRAEQIGGDAYLALRDKQSLEQAVKAIRNVVDGYGDHYIIPTRSLLDGLAADFGHTAAGEALKAAREHTRRMVEQNQAASCDYVEANRRETAIRFVIDAFNGRVDAILTRTKHDNYGTLEQEIRDAFSLVNLNGQAFREAKILPAYLDARLAELKWAVVVQELRLKEREEQRRIQEQIREEEKARREYERAMQEAAKEESAIKKALEKAQIEVAKANAEQRAKFEEQISALNQRLIEAEAKNQRAMSMAQRTRAGHVYIISNIGSFGDQVFKIGMTRRLEPLDRIWELGDASVPFDFDVHAIIYSEDAPQLEKMLHEEFDDLRVNKVKLPQRIFQTPIGTNQDIRHEKES